MLEPMYNGFLFFILAMWLLGILRLQGPRRLSSWVGKHNRFAPAIVWVILVAFLIGYVIFFNTLTREHDIPDAVNSAVLGYDNGLNPYVDKVVPRFDSTAGTWHALTYGTYNYLPLDLFVYSGMHELLGVLGFPAWFIISNIIFSCLAFAIFHELAPVKLASYIPFAGIIALFYSFDNCSLTILLMVLSIYVLKKYQGEHSSFFALLLMGLAVMTKVYVIVPFAVLFLWLLQDWLSTRKPFEIVRLGAGLGASAGMGALLMLPFGLSNVLNSAVFFHLSASTRGGTTSGGTVLAELAMNNPYYVYIAVGAVAVALLASLVLRNLNDRIVLVSSIFLMVVVKSSLSLATIPGLFLVIRFYEWSHAPLPRDNQDRPTITAAKDVLSVGDKAG